MLLGTGSLEVLDDDDLNESRDESVGGGSESKDVVYELDLKTKMPTV